MDTNENTHLLKAERGVLRSLSRSYPGGERGLNNLDDEIGDSPDAVLSGEYEPLERQTSSQTRTLGTFQGVFAPVSLSILSSILFLRVGYIVGNVGFLETLLQFGIAYTILISTVLSICAIATNGAVEGGGVYFMISRTLGMEFGGAIGILFWFANIVSSALYLAACTEGLIGNFGPTGSLAQILPSSKWWNFAYASLFNSLNLCVCLVGSKLFGKTSALILGAVMISVTVTIGSFFPNEEFHQQYVYNATKDCIPPTDNVSLPNCTKPADGTFIGFAGASSDYIKETFTANLYPRFEFDCSDPLAEVNFFTVFGVLFSGVTGIMSGANMSGELISPGKNIPRGTLSACFFTLGIFLILSLLTAMTCNPALLLHDCMYLNAFNVWPPIVAIGVLLATFSASLNNLIGASRILEAVAKDVLFGHLLAFFTKGTVKDNPVTSIMVTWFLVELFLLMGSLNNIAQLTSVLFLMSYAAVNLACLGLDLASAPNFRPSFKYFSWHTCLVGLLGTAVMMFFVSPLFSAVALLLCLSLVFALNFISPIRKPNWGSISQALLFHQVRKYLLLLDPRKDHVKFWRPQILLLVSNPRTCCSLIDFVNALKKGGLYVLGHVYTERLQDSEEDPCMVKNDQWLSLIDHLKIKAFVELTMASSLREGIQHLVRISGIGAMKPNTIILGYLDERFHGDDFNSPYSAFATKKFEGIFPFLRTGKEETSSITSHDQNTQESMSKVEYVGIICDILKMQKNVCLSRHFSLLNKGNLFGSERESIFGTRAKKKLYLDVWLVDFFSPFETDISDTTSLFLLQLACIVHMVPRWKLLSLRVFITVRDHRTSLANQEEMLKNMLELLRVEAESHVLSWTPESTELTTDPHVQLSPDYLRSACETVRRRSQDTAVSFLYLPKPPQHEEEYMFYLDSLTTLTQNWPPTLLAYIFCSLLLFALPMFIEDYTMNVKLFLLPYLLPIIHIALVGSIYSTVALAVERYITVCHPFVRFRSGYKSKAFIIPIIIFSLGYTIPKFFELRLEDVPINGGTALNESLALGNGTLVDVEPEAQFKTLLVPTSLRRNKLYIRIYLIWINLFAQIIIPFVLLVTMNYKIYSTIKKSESDLRKNLRATRAGLSPDNHPGDTNQCKDQIEKVSASLLSVPNLNSNHPGTRSGSPPEGNKATSLRKREVTLSKVSIYIVFVFLFCHSVRIIPNTFELISTYAQANKARKSYVTTQLIAAKKLREKVVALEEEKQKWKLLEQQEQQVNQRVQLELKKLGSNRPPRGSSPSSGSGPRLALDEGRDGKDGRAVRLTCGTPLRLLTWNSSNLGRGRTKELALSHLLFTNTVDVAVITEAELDEASASVFAIAGYNTLLPTTSPGSKVRVLALVKTELALKSSAKLMSDIMLAGGLSVWDDKSPLIFPLWVRRFTNLSHLLITLASSVNFYIYYAKYGNFCGLRKRFGGTQYSQNGGGRMINTDTSFNLVIRSLDDTKRNGHTYTIRANLPNPPQSARAESVDFSISNQLKENQLPQRTPPDGQECSSLGGSPSWL
eukprot:snap_masked-scaffold132_size323655-processed-gene-1.0 protein:Tk07902 transcript:snap_masked-scaffold132_size323655-processed-gene-1.0-mRNA-1 annotation:"solute carrier family 12 member 9"